MHEPEREQSSPGLDVASKLLQDGASSACDKGGQLVFVFCRSKGCKITASPMMMLSFNLPDINDQKVVLNHADTDILATWEITGSAELMVTIGYLGPFPSCPRAPAYPMHAHLDVTPSAVLFGRWLG